MMVPNDSSIMLTGALAVEPQQQIKEKSAQNLLFVKENVRFSILNWAEYVGVLWRKLKQ